MKLVFDTYALMTYLRREPNHHIVRSLLADTLHQNHESYMSVINLGELFYMRWRKGSQAEAESALKFVRRMGIHIEPATNERVMNAAGIKAIVSLSYADAFAAALAEELNATLVTGDLEYKPLEPKINILWL
jgi:predicted nucleic acid-binding protein